MTSGRFNGGGEVFKIDPEASVIAGANLILLNLEARIGTTDDRRSYEVKMPVSPRESRQIMNRLFVANLLEADREQSLG